VGVEGGTLDRVAPRKGRTIEFVHDVIKNDLARLLPSKYFGANAAWLRLAVIAHNVLGR